jgi:hypothetical protein
MDSHGSQGAPASILHKLAWAHTKSLAAWACAAACAVLERLPAGADRSGYRHVSAESQGTRTHELLELQSGLVVNIIYQWDNGATIAGFCQPWPDVLARFADAFLHRDLLGAEPTGRGSATFTAGPLNAANLLHVSGSALGGEVGSRRS